MRVLDFRKRFKLIWLVLLASFLILLFACGNGVSQEEFDAEQARAQELEVRVQALQQRLNRVAAITEVLDSLTSSFEEGTSGESLLQFSVLVHATGGTEYHAKWHEVVESMGSEPPSPETLNAITAAVRASGNLQLAEKWREVVASVQREGGAAVFLEFAALARTSGDPAVQALLLESFEAVRGEGNASPKLVREFEALLEASGNAQVQEDYKRLGDPQPEVTEEVREERVRMKLQTIGDPSLGALFEAAYESAGGGVRRLSPRHVGRADGGVTVGTQDLLGAKA